MLHYNVSVHRAYTCGFKGLADEFCCERGLPSTSEQWEEVLLLDGSQLLRFEEIIAKSSGVASAKKLKANHFERLKRMGGVRRKNGQGYFVSLAVLNKVH
jgi:hypothetical protein